MLEAIQESLMEMTVVGRSTGQDDNQVSDQDKSPVERPLSVLVSNVLSAAET